MGATWKGALKGRTQVSTYKCACSCKNLHTVTHEHRVVHPCARTHCSPPLAIVSWQHLFFFLPLSNLSSPAKICFLSPCGSVHTDATFQLSEERGRQKTGLINRRNFWQWHVSQGCSVPFFFLPHPFLPSFLTYLSSSGIIFLILPYVPHNSTLSCQTALFSRWVSQTKRHIACKATKGKCDCVKETTGL